MERVNTVNRSTIRLEAIRMVMEELTQTPMLMPSLLQMQMPKQTQQLTQQLTQELMQELMQELIPSLERTATLFKNRDTILEMLQPLPSERTILS